MKNIEELQTEVGLWSEKQFGGRNALAGGLLLVEEAGEVCRAVLKRNQVQNGKSNRSGSVEDWRDEIRVEAADTLIALLFLAEAENFDLFDAAVERFEEVRQRRRVLKQKPAMLGD